MYDLSLALLKEVEDVFLSAREINGGDAARDRHHRCCSFQGAGARLVSQ